MSQLFESLRRGRSSAAGADEAGRARMRSAKADSVLATMGYATRRRGVTEQPVVLLAIALALAGAAWAYWLFTGTRAEPIQPVASIRPPASASPSRPPAPRNPSPVPSSGGAPMTPITPPAGVRAEQDPEPRAPAREARVAEPATPNVRVAAAAGREPGAFDRAVQHHRKGDLEKAHAAYVVLLAADERNAHAHNNLGLLYQDRGKLDDAIREFRRALEIDPQYTTAQNNLGVALMAAGQLDAASTELRAAVTRNPRDVDAAVNLALAQKAGGQAEAAKETLLRGLGLAPRHAPAHYNLAVLYEQSGETARAVEHYRAFLEHAGSEYAARISDVRARVDMLSRSFER